ncbi:alkaline phosphatase family protein [Paludibacterium purpuratum]|uniref:Type I phosphodiesterase/nucleotide pyrophosphatase n=1 Tax=Paludibacterium purpuratum TaxID=1144873 RepID=A0A4R7B9I9_9NEIS|nr:alkaline phosphatase family protein [Paludibacterium purpuratum]TDR81488.1 type I phosphodiesterase/nucleotide pyrophosphatase [Paludibacterium purpuratum]
MRKKVILVLIDGLAWQVARDSLGYLLGLCEAQRATGYSLRAALPSLSRPLYECILTGVAPVDSGIVHNDVNRLSNQQSLFHLARSAGLTTAAAAYHWFSELYNRSPYLASRDRLTDDPALPIQHGMFYHRDDYPDDHLLLDAEMLRQRHDPDFLLIHPMNVDDTGHRHGLDSAAYRNAARRIDTLLSAFLPTWREQGYQILITSDHGMNADHTHGGSLPEEREVPLFVLGDGFSHRPGLAIAQTALCGSMAQLLGLDHDKPYCLELLA